MTENIYGDESPVGLPRYTYRDAARATGVPATTIASWFRGQTWYGKASSGYFRPVLQRPDPDTSRLSFNNLLEVHVLRALRNVHEVKLDKVRKAIETAEQEYGIQNLLISNQLHAGSGELFLRTYSELVHLSQSHQLIMQKMFDQYIQRITVDGAHADLLPFYPFPRMADNASERLILVSPFVAFGSAVVSRLGVSTATIAQRAIAGEPRDAIVADYGLLESEFDEAILYEAAA